eukprot:TRINITY_DN8038_c0_g2_i1.p2 TRINITY_DN8038_c0_g2~~TRINITY_DN8038_c0_g2_i1.p2  ORF type:complete len:160 (-),score=24.01 TRINITY_DN8038_c0_g2_i1:1045-1524(-)
MGVAHPYTVTSWNSFNIHKTTTQIHPQAWVDDLIIFCCPSEAIKAARLVYFFFKEYHMNLNFAKSKFLAINSDLKEITIQDTTTYTISRVSDNEFIRLLGFYFNQQLSPDQQWGQATKKADSKLANIMKSNTNISTWGAGVMGKIKHLEQAQACIAKGS